MYRTRQAAQYVGMNFSTFVYHVEKGHVQERGRVKGERLFERGQLDEFKQKYMSDAGVTKEDICARYGQGEGEVRGQLRRKRLKPIARSGRSFKYDAMQVHRMAVQLGWKSRDGYGVIPSGSANFDVTDLSGGTLSKDLVEDVGHNQVDGKSG